MKRYHIEGIFGQLDCEMCEQVDGEFMLYEDHEAEVARIKFELTDEIRSLRYVLRSLAEKALVAMKIDDNGKREILSSMVDKVKRES